MAANPLARSDPALADVVSPGLSQEEVAQRLANRQVNSLPPPTGRTYSAIVRENVFTFINTVLFLLGIALVAIGEISDAIVAVGVVLGNILVSVFQELKAKCISTVSPCSPSEHQRPARWARAGHWSGGRRS